MPIAPKNIIRFQVWADVCAEPGSVEIRVTPDRWGGWQARAVLTPPGQLAPVALGRVFRSTDRDVAAGKMITWVRRRFARARAVSSLRAARAADRLGQAATSVGQPD
jgi:hypothetical protein